MKILILSSLPKDSGCWLRAYYLADSLRPCAEVSLVDAYPKMLPFLLEMFLITPYNIIKILFSDADIFIGIKPFPTVTIPLFIAKFLKHKKTSLDIDDVDFAFFKGWKSKIIHFLQKPFPRLFDVITYHNDALKDFIIKEFGVEERKLYRLRQGVDTKLFAPKHNIPMTIDIFHMANMGRGADIDTILNAVAIVQKNKPVNFTIAGGGPFKKHFQRLAGALKLKIRFTGQLSKKSMAEELAKANVCLVYFSRETANLFRSSMKLREYLAMGKKVVCNTYGELVNFKEYVYACGDSADDMAQKILEALDGGDNREARGLRHVKENFDWVKIGKEYFDTVLIKI